MHSNGCVKCALQIAHQFELSLFQCRTALRILDYLTIQVIGGARIVNIAASGVLPSAA